jgi:hypothetical protein
MLNELNNFYDNLTEPNQSCFLALRKIIMDFDPEITEEWKYKLPFFHYKKKPFCYVWKDKKTTFPYIGIVRCTNIIHPNLEAGNRKKMKIFSINPTEDIDVKSIYTIFEEVKKLY